MRAIASTVIVLASLLAACGKEQPAANGSATAPVANTPSGPVVTGIVMADKPATLPPSATLTVRLLDITKVDAEPMQVATLSVPVAAIPAEFTLTYSPADVNPIRSYAVDATVMAEGQVRYVSSQRQGVITQGKPSRASIMMVAALTHVEKDPAVELNAEFAEFEKMLGGLKRFQGSRIVGPEGKQIAIGWDGFADETGVRMVRQQKVNDADGTRVTERFAYLDGKPWVAIREAGGSTTKIGWDAEGNVVVAERNDTANEDAKSLADDLKQAATEARDIAAERVPG